MRSIIVLAVCISAFASAAVFRGRPHLDSHWDAFKGKHGKQFRNATEEAHRRKHWEANRDTIENHNNEAAAGLHSYTLQENHMSDWTPEEKQQLLGRRKVISRSELLVDVQLTENERQSLPASVDLRNNSCMAPIQNQGNCGSCYAFGSTAATEFRLCRKKGSFTKLSEQQIVACSKQNGGCNGGLETWAWDYIKSAPGQATSAKYPYTSGTSGTSGTCKYTSSMAGGTVTGHSNYYAKTSLSAMQSQLAYNGTLTASIDAVNSFMNFGSGVYSETKCATDGQNTNHVVALVGYGTLNNVPYWILRNSWGTSWGMKGYALIKRGSNTCNIESQVLYPTV